MVAEPKSLPPSAFPELPTWIVAQLTQRECRIPQSHRRKKDNVIQGAFKQPGRTDWAVLCKTKTETKLLVFTQGEDPVGVEKVQNGLYADVSIQVASPLFMADYLQKSQVKPAALPKLDHDGLWYWLGPRNPDSH